MGFWIFMLMMNLPVPFTMIGFGGYFVKSGGPEEINMAFGYRTSMSMKNRDTWTFAHVYCGKLWRAIGWVMLFASIGVMLLVPGKNTDTAGTVGAVLCGIQLFALAATIIPTEIALKKLFDKNGNRKN